MKKYSKEQIEFCLDILKEGTCPCLSTILLCEECLIQEECHSGKVQGSASSKEIAIEILKRIIE